MAIMTPHLNQLHVLFCRHRKFMFVLLGDVVEVDIGDWVIAAIGQVEVKILRTIQINPIFSIRVVVWNIVRLEHLSFQLLLLEQQLLHHLLTYVNAILRLLLFSSLLVQLLFYLRNFKSLHDDNLHLLNRTNL